MGISTQVLVLASGNAGKIAEFRELLPAWQVESLADHGVEQVEEVGETFEENARAKAQHAARQTGKLVLADDSGLEVDALGGEPGVRSARFAGVGAADEAHVALLLERMANVPAEERTARFRCVIALCGVEFDEMVQGTVEGRVAIAPAGARGFGYDPIFIPTGMHHTFAELQADEKNAISHRAEAVKQVVGILSSLD